MIIVITYKSGEVEKIESDKIRFVGGSAAYIGKEEKPISLDQITYIEIDDDK